MTNRAAISRIRSSFKMNSADSEISDRAILAELNSTKSKFIKQQSDRRKLWDSPNIFTPLHIDLVQVPLAESCDYQSDCVITRSKYKIPKIAEGIFGLLTMGAYSLDKKKKFIEASPSRYANILRLGLPKKDIYYWFYNNYLYTSSETLEVIILPAYVESDIPKEFSVDCEDTNAICPVNPLDNEFKCPSYLEKDIIADVSNYYLQTYKRSTSDNTADNIDEGR